MLQTCRPAGRLFYLVLAVVMAASGVRVVAGEVAAKNGEKPTSSSEAKARRGRACGEWSFAQSTERSDADQRGRHRLSGGWDTGTGGVGDYVAGVRDGERERGGSGNARCDAGNERSFECGTRGERGSNAGGCLLHGGVPVGARRSANGVLGGADEFSGNAGAWCERRRERERRRNRYRCNT